MSHFIENWTARFLKTSSSCRVWCRDGVVFPVQPGVSGASSFVWGWVVGLGCFDMFTASAITLMGMEGHTEQATTSFLKWFYWAEDKGRAVMITSKCLITVLHPKGEISI